MNNNLFTMVLLQGVRYKNVICPLSHILFIYKFSYFPFLLVYMETSHRYFQDEL